jgi:hypothetical protein
MALEKRKSILILRIDSSAGNRPPHCDSDRQTKLHQIPKMDWLLVTLCISSVCGVPRSDGNVKQSASSAKTPPAKYAQRCTLWELQHYLFYFN